MLRAIDHDGSEAGPALVRDDTEGAREGREAQSALSIGGATGVRLAR